MQQKWWAVTLILLMCLCISVTTVHAQNTLTTDYSVPIRKPKPGIAFLKSLIIPGWGHYYVNKHHWTRGKFQLAAAAILLVSYLELRSYTNHLKNDMFTYAAAYSGTDIRSRGTQFQLNVASYNSLAQYNDYQERARNWGQLYPQTSKYMWNWQSEKDRLHYVGMKNRYDRTRQQLPTLITLMVANRIISGISAYIRARKADARDLPKVALSVPLEYGTNGIQANITIPF